MGAAALAKLDFYPRPPRGGRRPSLRATTCHTYFYPRPPRGGRPSASSRTASPSMISIHALREEGDPRRGCRRACQARFLSTPSARRATTIFESNYLPYIFLSTPSARRATVAGQRRRVRRRISIHALREEGDTRPPQCPGITSDFYPRPPRGGRHVIKGLLAMSGKFLSTPSARRATWCGLAMA